MRKDKRLVGILSLAAATVVVMGASIAVGKQPDNLNPPEVHVTGLPSQSEGENGGTVAVVEGEKVDLTGADASIVDAVKTAEGTYVLTIETTGYNESKPITLQVTYSADAQTVLGYEVVSHGETPGLGANIEGADFKNQFAGVALPVYVPGMDMSAFGESTDEPAVEQETETQAQVLFRDGEYAIETEPSSDGSVVRVTMTVENGKIAKMTWDEGKEGAWKSELSANGQYVMKPIWKTQAESMCAYVVENQSTDGLNLTDAGKTDVVAGVSISVNTFADLVNEAITEANGADGTYEKVKDDAVFVSVTIADGKITAVTWDEKQNGEWKSELSVAGKYVMKPIWKTQAESMCAYVVENQSTKGLNLNDNGKTDVVAGVSVSVSQFVELADELIAEATVAGAYKDGTYEYVKDDTIYVTLTVEGGKVTNVTWDELQNGEWKSELSAAGKYVMKPIWKTQAESMCAYVVENQSTDGLNLTDAGKTDAVAGVSISVNTFADLVNEAIAEANGADVTYEKVKDDAVFVSVTIADGKITAVTWDEKQNGEWKSALSEQGKYVMKPIWKTQAERMCAYVVENQSTAGLNVNDNGKTDVVAGVSISVNTFVDLVNEALVQAGGTADIIVQEQAKKEEETATIDATKIDAISGATVSSKAVARAVNNGYLFLKDYVK